MSASFNHVVLVGNLTADPDMQYTSGGSARTKFSIAVNRRYKDSAGQLQEEVVFVPIIAWGSLAENCSNYLAKGRSVLVEGWLRIRDFVGDDGVKRKYTEVVAQNVQFLGASPKTTQEGAVNHKTAQESFANEEVPF